MHYVFFLLAGFVGGVIVTAIYGHKAKAELADRVKQLEAGINQHLP